MYRNIKYNEKMRNIFILFNPLKPKGDTRGVVVRSCCEG